MPTHEARVVLLLVLAALPLAIVDAAPPIHPYPQNVSYAPGSLTPSQRPLTQLNAEVAAAYWRWKGAYLAQAGTESDGQPRYRVRSGAGAATDPTVSEGQGYGMLVVALMAGEDPDAQTVFDGLWEFCNDHRSTVDDRLMDWHVPADESAEPGDDDSAFDGDCDIAFALLLAEQQWGNGGRVTYRARAASVIAGLRESAVGPDSHLPMLGDWVNPNGATYNQWTTRSSDFMPDHFRAFARVTGDSSWNTVIRQTQDVVDSLQFGYSPVAGLLPDFVVPVSSGDPTPQPAPANFLEGPYDGAYYYNAGRDPWRLGVDALLSSDVSSRAQALKMAQWIRGSTGNDPARVRAGYQLDGSPIATEFSSFFAASFGVAMMLNPSGQGWLNEVYEAVRERQEDSYADTVTLLAMLVMTRNYWDPSSPPAPVCDPPATPTGVVASAPSVPSGATYSISWDAAALADSYEVQEAIDPAFAGAASTTTTQLATGFQHAVVAATTYHYRVRALRSCVAESPWSTAASVTVNPPGCVGFRLLVAGVASRPGVGGTSWKTSLAVSGVGPAPANLALTYRYTVGSAAASATVPAGGIVGWDDVVATLFGVDGTSAGAVEVCADHEVVVQARTYNDATSGTFGQFLPGVTGADMLGDSDVGFLGQLRKSERFRTNVGFVNAGPAPCDVRVTLLGAGGEQLGISLERTVPAGDWYQFSDVFGVAGVSWADLATARVVVATAGGLVWAYASVVDNGSGDPTTVPMVILPD